MPPPDEAAQERAPGARRREALTALAIAVALAATFLAPIVTRWENWGIQDWDQHTFYHAAGRVSILEYGQIPHWNPYYCGGTDLLANPQSRVLSPTFVLLLAFGTVAGLKLEIALFAVAGMLGAYALGRFYGLGRLGAWIAPVLCFLGPFYALPVSGGMTWVFSTAYIPWVVLAFERRPRTAGAVVLAGAGLALMFLGGGAYPVPITLTFLGLLTLLSLRRGSIVKPLAALLGVVAVMLALGAVKFLPSMAFMREFPRHFDNAYGFSAESLAVGLFHRDQRTEAARTQFPADSHERAPDALFRGISSDYDDVGMYVGPVAALLALIGLVARGRALWKLAVAVPIFVWLSLGDRAPISLFSALHKLPVYESFWYPERFRLIWFPILCLFAGCGLDAVRRGLTARFGPRVGLACASLAVAAIAGDAFAVTRPIYRSTFIIPPMAPQHFGEFRQIRSLPSYDARGFSAVPDAVYAAWSAHYPALLMNRGTVECYETAFVPRGLALPMGSAAYRGEAHLEGGAGTVTTASWTPNRLRFEVDAESPAVLVVNQNYYDDWTASDGRPVSSRDGLISVAVGPEDRVIELSFERSSFPAALWISGFSWVMVVLRLLSGGRAVGRARRGET